MGAIRAAAKTFFSKTDPSVYEAFPRPIDPADYELPALDGSGIPVAEIPLDGTTDDASPEVWAPRTLAASREPLAPGFPDLRGVWEVYEGRMTGSVQRIEQAGNRITVTVGGLVHDMFCDGTLENGGPHDGMVFLHPHDVNREGDDVRAAGKGHSGYDIEPDPESPGIGLIQIGDRPDPHGETNHEQNQSQEYNGYGNDVEGR